MYVPPLSVVYVCLCDDIIYSTTKKIEACTRDENVIVSHLSVALLFSAVVVREVLLFDPQPVSQHAATNTAEQGTASAVLGLQQAVQEEQ